MSISDQMDALRRSEPERINAESNDFVSSINKRISSMKTEAEGRKIASDVADRTEYLRTQVIKKSESAYRDEEESIDTRVKAFKEFLDAEEEVSLLDASVNLHSEFFKKYKTLVD